MVMGSKVESLLGEGYSVKFCEEIHIQAKGLYTYLEHHREGVFSISPEGNREYLREIPASLDLTADQLLVVTGTATVLYNVS